MSVWRVFKELFRCLLVLSLLGGSPAESALASSQSPIAFLAPRSAFSSKAGGFAEAMRRAGYADIQALFRAATRGVEPLGQGGSANVYTIPKLNGYVLRVRGTLFCNGNLEEINHPLAGLQGVGYPVARVGDNVTVLARVPGISLRDWLLEPSPNGRSGLSRNGFMTHEELFSMISAAPQEAFDHLAALLQEMSRRGYWYECSLDNMLWDRVSKRFGVVDVDSKGSARDHTVAAIAFVVGSLLGESFSGNGQSHDQQAVLRHAQTFLVKSLIASQTAHMPVPEARGAMGRIFMDYIFQKVGWSGQWSDVRAALLSGDGVLTGLLSDMASASPARLVPVPFDRSS